MGGRELSNADHLWTLREEIRDGNKYRYDANETKLDYLVQYLKGLYRHLIIRDKNIGAWMIVHSNMVSVTLLSATEFWYLLCARYNVSPLNLQSHCNVCGTDFGVTHALICSTGILIIACHNKIHDKLFYLA